MFSPVLKRSLTVAAAGAAFVHTMPTAHAEESSMPRQKLSIYDEPEPKRVVIESPTKLEEHVAVAQKYVDDALEEGKTHVDSLHSQVRSVENDIRATINDIIAEDEEVLPNAVYIGVAALAGTIIARNRNIVLRFLTSTAMAVGTSYYLLPKTTHNLAVQLEKLERKYPELAKAHDSVNDAVNDARKQIDDTLDSLRGQFGQQVKESTDAAFATTKEKVESMYSTRSNPGVEETLKKN
ncbi:apolipo protein O-domain-containing protein [Gongronella butleri]|nr:apolipo protein O-domain-containing protein [Gongronella butleri]